MTRRRTEPEPDALSLSFLDLISCGLGAAILLSLIYSVVRQEKPVDLTAPNFLEVTVIVHNPDPVMNFWIKPPGMRAYLVPLTAFDRVTGRLPPNHPLQETGNFMVLGLSPFGEDFASRDQQRGQQFLKVLVLDPLPGTWEIEVLYRDHRKWNQLDPNKPIPPVQVQRTVILPSQQLDEKKVQVAYGERSKFEEPIVVENRGRQARGMGRQP